jgi:hypothetical protein
MAKHKAATLLYAIGVAAIAVGACLDIAGYCFAGSVTCLVGTAVFGATILFGE